MNKKLIIKSMAIAITAIMLLTFMAACSKKTTEPTGSTGASTAPGETTAGTKTPDEVTLEFYMPSPVANVNDIDAVLEQFYKETKATLNTKIHFNFTTFDDIGQKVSLKLAAGEQVDGVFTAPWTNPSIAQMISKKQIANLDSYFNNDKYPGLKKAFTPEYLKNNSFIDATNEAHIYGIPFTHGFDAGGAIYYRLDLAEKYGVGEVKTYADLTKYYDAILANEKGTIPLTWNGSQDLLSDTLQKIDQPITTTHNYDTEVVVGSGVAIKADGTAYVSKTANRWSDPEYLKLLPAPLNAIDPLVGFKMAREFYTKGYIEKDILAQKDPDGQFMSGKAASVFRTLDVYSAQSQQLEAAIPGAKLGYFIVDPGYRSGTAKAVGSDFKAWNFTAIPTNSKNIERTMQFYDWLFTNLKNHDLFEFGIEGKHWTAEGDTKYSIPTTADAKNNYNFPGFVLSWNPTMVRYDSKTPDDIVKVLNNLGDTNFFYKKPTAGFSFVAESLKSETAKINDLRGLLRSIGDGVIEDIPGTLAKIQKQYDKAGFQKIQTELEKQYNDYLKKNPYEGQ
ncbi:extracellular solute-binding protein [Paenibacillus psychroresistens]|uniref:Extracellular solute-binding protein n=1 Tax=Paenibacillus psychroresistens TaxID=1778678 RepID=A0A6B8RSJ4_9BACL|nr:DUF3502 domain-containing protein [Paenibacillus psychroresistens]QGQ98188.1 extracellular solute-binding protein [Paenibacillus psychroresistens]